MITFNISLLKEYLHNKAILFELFKPFGISNVQLNDLLKVIEGKTGGQIFTATHRIIKNRKEIIVLHEETRDEVSFYIKTVSDLKEIPGIEYAEYSDVTDKFKILTDPSAACIDSEKLIFPCVNQKMENRGLFLSDRNETEEETE